MTAKIAENALRPPFNAIYGNKRCINYSRKHTKSIDILYGNKAVVNVKA